MFLDSHVPRRLEAQKGCDPIHIYYTRSVLVLVQTPAVHTTLQHLRNTIHTSSLFDTKTTFRKYDKWQIHSIPVSLCNVKSDIFVKYNFGTIVFFFNLHVNLCIYYYCYNYNKGFWNRSILVMVWYFKKRKSPKKCINKTYIKNKKLLDHRLSDFTVTRCSSLQ